MASPKWPAPASHIAKAVNAADQNIEQLRTKIANVEALLRTHRAELAEWEQVRDVYAEAVKTLCNPVEK